MSTEATINQEPQTQAAPVYGKDNPFPARLTEHRMLTKDGSAKDTRHYVVDLSGSGLTYECGDSLAILPTNIPDLADEIIARLGVSGDELVESPRTGAATPFRDVLIHDVQITQPHTKLVKEIVTRTTWEGSELKKLVETGDRTTLNEYLWGREIIDLLNDHEDVRFTPAEFTGLCKKLAVRLYSIASSPRQHPEEVHLTVDTVRYDTFGRIRHGVASTFLSDRCELNDTTIPVFIQPGKAFRLPEDGATDIIMVGPGTGVAPFRAFLQDRKATGASGRNWLFFGSQHAATDFFYEEEFEQFQKEGFLHRLDTAFSRDQEHKIYVQDRMGEASAEIWQWLQNGAHFFVCGDASRMAKDVDAMLHQIAQTQGGMSEDDAQAYVKELKKDKRYKRDVY